MTKLQELREAKVLLRIAKLLPTLAKKYIDPKKSFNSFKEANAAAKKFGRLPKDY